LIDIIHSFSMVNRLDNDSSFSSFADYPLDDELFLQDDDDDDASSSSTTFVDLANAIDSGMIGDPRAYNNSHGDDLLDESASGGTGDELFPTAVDYYAKTTTTTTTPKTITSTTTPEKPSTIMPKDDRRHPPVKNKKTVRFGSQEIRYFIALPNGQTHVTEHQVQLLLPAEPQQLRRQRRPSPPPPTPQEETKLSIIAEDDRWRPYRASSLLMCRQPARR
jgi:hypothetical protein